MTDTAPQATAIDGAELNRLWEEWKRAIYHEFPGCSIRDSVTRNDAERTTRFVSIAAFMAPVKVVAIWTAKALDSPGGHDIAITEKTLDEPTTPDDLPEPLRTLARVATRPPIRL